ncbi:egg cell-secreted protein 1.1-like [Melia azedarach]|uniref:Egg cell-secreted protein 1.1-like n=1 Tax=Melia azedarach TaxID=155640 RepID=A0ACC1XVJ3_MELAZ|nr:egg cell-secreted protein 1.1-like [Melia azedarach]
MDLKNVFLLFVFTCLMAYATAAGENPNNINKPGQDLAARLDANAGQMEECWKGIQQLLSCNQWYIQFFISHKLSPECCGAIQTVSTKCWPIDLPSFGFFLVEGNILKAFCASATSSPTLN